MFFFFVGGVNQQVRQVLQRDAGRCINCRSPADLVEVENVLKLFFVPVWRWPGKNQLMHCNNCGIFFPPSVSLPPPDSQPDPQLPSVNSYRHCDFCGKRIHPDYKFCPFCGAAL